MERFAEIVHGFKQLAIFAKCSVLDVWLVLALCSYATVTCFVFGALFYFKISVKLVLILGSWRKLA